MLYIHEEAAIMHACMQSCSTLPHPIVVITRCSQLSSPQHLLPFLAYALLLITQSIQPPVELQDLQSHTFLQRLQCQTIETSSLLTLQLEVGLDVLPNRYYGGAMSIGQATHCLNHHRLIAHTLRGHSWLQGRRSDDCSNTLLILLLFFFSFFWFRLLLLQYILSSR